MKEYDLISVGTGSAMMIVEALVQDNPRIKVAVIDKDEPGGICLTKGCIPSKLLLYSAELVRTIERAGELGIEVDLKRVDFLKVMERMRNIIYHDIDMIRMGLSLSKNIDYYHAVAEFVTPYTLKVGNDIITSKMIILCTGSKPTIPPIEGLENVGYLTSDTILKMNVLPESFAIIGGGYIAAEYGHFLSAMGSKVSIIGRNPQFLPQEEPEISALAKKKLEQYLIMLTNHEVQRVIKTSNGLKKLVMVNRQTSEEAVAEVDEILVATGRSPNSDILRPEIGGIETDKEGWIKVNEYLETSQPNIWALGDADGNYQFKHVANYEALIVYYNAILKRKMKVDYHAIPHAVFTDPEIASVGFGEKEAIEKYGKDKIMIGFQRYENTAKGEVMNVKDCFVKVIIKEENMQILGAHIIGPQASVLIQEIINLMYTPEQSAIPITRGMHIHPALSEVVERAFRSLISPDHYHHYIDHNLEMR